MAITYQDTTLLEKNHVKGQQRSVEPPACPCPACTLPWASATGLHQVQDAELSVHI